MILVFACALLGVHGWRKEGPNAKVQGRPLGVAEASSGGGVPCNAQLGEWLMRMSEACVGPHLNKPSMRFASVLVGLSPL